MRSGTLRPAGGRGHEAGLAVAAPGPDLRARGFRLQRLWRYLDGLAMRAGRRWLGGALNGIVHLAAFGSIAVITGVGSAWYAVDAGTPISVVRRGPWVSWPLASDPDADPYTRAHFARLGWLPMAAGQASYYMAGRDSAGGVLYADCEYAISGPPPKARRWTLVAYDTRGVVIDAGAGRLAIDSTTAMPAQGGTVSIRVSAAARPGNWLPVTGSGAMSLLLTVFGEQPVAAVTSEADAASAGAVLAIERVGCR